jgi:tetratricopeptide (TPR) repeat protein
MRHITSRIVTLLVLLLAAAAVPSFAVGQEQGLGELEFVNSGAPQAQHPFIRGLLLLHSFEYEDAREAFQAAREIDPDFVMAYWGEAQTHNHPIWQQQDRDAAQAALAKLGATAEARYAKAGTERELDYLRTVEVLYGAGDKRDRDYAYSDAMRQLMLKYPDDADARAFYALSILGTCHDGRDSKRYMKAAATVEEVYARNPEHPGALHYLIHSYDDPTHAPLGLRAARLYSEVAQRAGHALHMPTHIFVALGMWDEVAGLNEESWQASLRRQQRKGLGKATRGYHARLWEHYAFLQQGRFSAARALIDEFVAELGTDGDSPGMRGVLGAMRAAQIVAAESAGLAGIVSDLDVRGATRASHQYGQLVAALKRQDRGAAEAALRDVSAMLGGADSGDWRGRSTPSRIVELEMRALLALDGGDTEGAIKQLQEAAALEDDQPFAFGPPVPVKPAHELLADVMHATGDSGAAITHYDRALERTPGRAVTLLGLARAAEAAGQSARATAAYAQLRDNWVNADAGLADLAEIRQATATGGER